MGRTYRKKCLLKISFAYMLGIEIRKHQNVLKKISSNREIFSPDFTRFRNFLCLSISKWWGDIIWASVTVCRCWGHWGCSLFYSGWPLLHPYSLSGKEGRRSLFITLADKSLFCHLAHIRAKKDSTTIYTMRSDVYLVKGWPYIFQRRILNYR